MATSLKAVLDDQPVVTAGPYGLLRHPSCAYASHHKRLVPLIW